MMSHYAILSEKTKDFIRVRCAGAGILMNWGYLLNRSIKNERIYFVSIKNGLSQG